MDKIMEEFNTFFEGDATAGIVNGKLHITIGSRTLVISLPAIVGAQATGIKAQSYSP